MMMHITLTGTVPTAGAHRAVAGGGIARDLATRSFCAFFRTHG